MVTSPKVATYDLQPEMSALGVAEKLSERIAEGQYEFLMNNFAPPVRSSVSWCVILPFAHVFWSRIWLVTLVSMMQLW